MSIQDTLLGEKITVTLFKVGEVDRNGNLWTEEALLDLAVSNQFMKFDHATRALVLSGEVAKCHIENDDAGERTCIDEILVDGKRCPIPVMMVSPDDDVDRAYNEFWKDIIEIDGRVSLEQVKKELFDYRNILSEVSRVYDRITYGNISKPNTKAESVIAVVEDLQNESINEAVREALGIQTEEWVAALENYGVSDEIIRKVKQDIVGGENEVEG